MNKLFIIIAFFFPGLLLSYSGSAQAVTFQFNDISGVVNSFINIPVKATTTLTGKGVVAYTMQFSYSASDLLTQGVITTGTISNAFGTPAVNTSVPGIITVAAAGSSPLTGTGDFIILRFKIMSAGVTTVSNTGPANNFLNEGTPALSYQNSCNVTGTPTPTITITPGGTTVLLKGQTQPFSATGGTAPYSWISGNTTVATISSAGLLTTSQIGFTTVKATDVNGYFGINNNIEVRGYQLSIPDTFGTYNNYINIPVRVTNLSGLNVLSGTFIISYTPSLLSDIQILTSNSLMQTFSQPIVNVSTPGIIRLSFANSTSLSGAGVLFWVKAKLNNVSGGTSALNILEGLLNEELVPIVKNGSINYNPPASISIVPNNGQLVYGDSLQLSVSGAATAPFSWTVSDPALASINSNGILKVKRSGRITVVVSDANGATSSSGIFQLYDTYVKIADVSGLPGTQIDIPVTMLSLPVGQSVFSIEGIIVNGNTSAFTLTDIVTAGTASASFFINKAIGSDYIKFAMAGVTAIPGNAVLFKLRGTINNDAVLGSTSILSFQNILLNEGTPLPLTQPGIVSVGSGLITVNVKLFLQGYYIGNGEMQPVLNNQAVPNSLSTESDTITIELHDPVTYELIDQKNTVLLTDGNATASFSQPAGPYYIGIRHRNCIQTWSANPISCTSATPLYNFTTGVSQGFADNQVEVEPGVWGFYVGDLNQDEFIDAFDYSGYNDDNLAGISGVYIATDMNGDGFVDAFDYSQYNDNNLNGIQSIHP